MAKKITCERLKHLIKDERKASKEYHKYGFHSLGKDESHHMHFLLKKLKKMRCR